MLELCGTIAPHVFPYFFLFLVDKTHITHTHTVATASVKHVFSAMKVLKSNLCNKMSNQWLRDALLTISNDVILSHFQQMDMR
jgi:hypothetical protein